MQIHGLNKTTLLDYPGKVASTIFLGHCNFQCVFCQNKSLVLNPGHEPLIPEEEVLSFLKKRKNLLDGVCISGGEPTLSEELPSFLKKIKDLGYSVKLDTNGYKPNIIKELYTSDLIDFIAMDIKGPYADYPAITGIRNFNPDSIHDSISFITNCGISYEFRTTVVKELFTAESFHQIGSMLSGCSAYYLQNFRDSDNVIKSGLHSCSKEDLLEYQRILLGYMSNVTLRGVD